MKRVAIVYDRVNKWGGAERVLLALHEMFPDAPLYTSVYDSKKASWAKVFPKIYTSFLQRLPFGKKFHELLGTFMPIAFESFDLGNYDLVISVTSEAAKGVVTKPSTFHLCYCLTPTRYLWSGYKNYFKNPVLKFISYPFVSYLRWWDRVAVKRPDKIVAISKSVQARIKKYYGIDSEIIFPPADPVDKKMKIQKRDAFLVVSRLDFGYKKVDLAIRAFNKLGLPLQIVGEGRESRKLKEMANKNIRFLGRVSDDELSEIYSKARALIMPQEEDFGIVSVESQSLGTPVIAYGKGGARDTVVNGVTGILFESQTVWSLVQAVKKFDRMSFNKAKLKANAKKFSKKIFKKQLQGSLVRADFGRRRRNQTLAQKQKKNSKTVFKPF